MILLLHIVVALTSIIFGTFLVFSPSMRKLHITYGLAAATIFTGVILVSQSAHMLQTCVTGLVYLSFIAIQIAVAQHRLATAKVRIRKDR